MPITTTMKAIPKPIASGLWLPPELVWGTAAARRIGFALVTGVTYPADVAAKPRDRRSHGAV